MSVMDPYFNKVIRLIDQLQLDGQQMRQFSCPTDITTLHEELPITVGDQANPGIILRGDTFVELGSPEAGSCAFLLWTDNRHLIRNGKITLIGPDISESEGDSLPFAQILMIGGKKISDAEHSALDQAQFTSNQIEGYMIRSTTERMWSRVSKEAVEKGFNFESLGKALMYIFRRNISKVQAMEIIFVTSSKEDVQRFDDISNQIREIGKNITRETWLTKGIDLLECTFGWDCRSCSYKPVCDEIRDVITVRKKRAPRKKASKTSSI